MTSLTEHQEKEAAARLKESAGKFLETIQKKFSFTLDYSESSLYAVDTILCLLFKDRQTHDLAVPLIGSFLGEILIANLGGKWEPHDFAVAKIGKMKGVAYPFRQAQKRLEKGFGEALTNWYAKLKMEFCLSGEVNWDGEIFEKLSSALLSQGWDEKLFHRIQDEEEKSYVREEAAYLFTRLKWKQISPVLLDWLSRPEYVYYACIGFQGIIEPKALPRLRALCRNGRDVAVRIQAIQALGEHRDRDSIPLLFQKLNDPDEVVCHYASQALGKIGGETVLKGLLDILSNRQPGNKVCAISALELIKDRASVPYLLESLFDSNEAIRESAARAFQYLPDPRAVPVLLSLLEDESSRMRILAAYALTFLGDLKAVEPMRKLLKDPVKDVRDHAAYLISLLESGQRPAGFCW